MPFQHVCLALFEILLRHIVEILGSVSSQIFFLNLNKWIFPGAVFYIDQLL